MPALATDRPHDSQATAELEHVLRRLRNRGFTPEELARAAIQAAQFPTHIGVQAALVELADAANDFKLLASALQTARQACHRQLAQTPLDWSLHDLVARLEYRLGHFPAAWNAYKRILDHKPDDAAAHLGLVKSGQPLGRWEAVDGFSPAKVPSLVANDRATVSNIIALPLPGTSPALLAAGRITSARLASEVVPLPSRYVRTAGPLHLGYVSPDYNDHAVAHQLPRVFELHDRSRFRVYAYDIGHNDDSPYRQRLLSSADCVRDCGGTGDASVARTIADDSIDILVDLAGHTLGARLGIFAHRPAPIAVTWLGYPATTGAPFIDYLIGDETVVAPDLRPNFSETIAYLPDCYLPADDHQAVAPATTRKQAGLPEDAVVLAALHPPYKLDATIVGTWLRILRRAPRTVLWLRAKEEDMQKRLREEAANLGVNPDRIVVDNHLLPKPEYMAKLSHADLFLDTRWFNGHSTVSDALWVGVPVLTVPGDAFAGRVAASILRASGLGELIAPDLAAYEEAAAALANSPSSLRALQARVRESRSRQSFFNSARFVHNLETAFVTMADRARAGLPKTDFRVPCPQ
jgi:predicted O-linked N-acetylglucosamine transferase (SPINDLY family)